MVFFKEKDDDLAKDCTIALKSEDSDIDETFAKKKQIVEEGLRAGERLSRKVVCTYSFQCPFYLHCMKNNTIHSQFQGLLTNNRTEDSDMPDPHKLENKVVK